jgi:hypothetical protein
MASRTLLSGRERRRRGGRENKIKAVALTNF